MKTKCLGTAVLLSFALSACGQNMPASIPTPAPSSSPSLPAGSQSLEVDLYLGTLTLGAAQAAIPYFTACGSVSNGTASPQIGAQPGPNTLIATAHSGPCNGSRATGTTLAIGYGTGTIVAGVNNDLTAVFGSGATTLTPVP